MSMILYLKRVEAAGPDELRTSITDPQEFMFGDSDNSRLVDFDKAWMAIMHVLTQFPDLAAPAKALFMGTGGTSVSSDPGYGPAIYISPQVAGDLKAGLDRLSNDELKQRYDPEAMEREYVYCADIFTHEPVEGWRYLAHGLDKLRRFLTDCSESESGVVKLLV